MCLVWEWSVRWMCAPVFRGTSLNLYLAKYFGSYQKRQRLEYLVVPTPQQSLKGSLLVLFGPWRYRLPIHKKYQTARSKYLFWYWGEGLVYLKGLLKDCCVTRFLIRYTWFSFHVLFDIWAHQPVIFQHLKLWLKVLPTIDKFRKNINVNIWLLAFSKYF